MNTPLDGLKVVELARILAGPWIGQTLADLGADVVKIESVNGDDTRRWGPPFIERDDDISAAYFHGTNRGKDSICVDFSDKNDLEDLLKIIAEADVLIENFKVGGLEKYGLDYKSIHTFCFINSLQNSDQNRVRILIFSFSMIERQRKYLISAKRPRKLTLSE